jgi:pilus assembly protein CpaC
MIAQNLRSAATALTLAAMAFFLAVAPAQSAGTAAAVPSKPVVIEMNEGRLIKLSDSASSVFIANPDIADVSVKSPRLVYVFGVQPGETTLYAVDKNDRMIASLKVHVEHNLSGLNGALKRVIPEGNVTATSIDGGIVLTGSVMDSVDAENARRLAQRYLAEKQEILNQIRVLASNQVNLRVTIAEVERSVIKQFGFNWENAFSSGDFFLGLATGPSDIITNGAGQFLLDSAQEHIVTQGQIGNFSILGMIDALSQDNLLTVLAEPNLSALSGETASFLAGGEFPFVSLDKDGRAIVSFKEFGVSLSFEPTVLSGGRISMRVRPEVSELSEQGAVSIDGFAFPGLRTRRAETTVELASGQSFAIAGLLLDSSAESLRGFPGISDVPILGQLFQSDRFQREETELLIVVTPYLVNPINGRFPLPTDNFVKRATPPVPGQRGLAQAPYGPEFIPLNDSGALAENAAGRPGFIVE